MEQAEATIISWEHPVGAQGKVDSGPQRFQAKIKSRQLKKRTAMMFAAAMNDLQQQSVPNSQCLRYSTFRI
jgi:hypothetical protein